MQAWLEGFLLAPVYTVMQQRSSTPPPGLWPTDSSAMRLDEIEQELLAIRTLLERIADRFGVRADLTTL